MAKSTIIGKSLRTSSATFFTLFSVVGWYTTFRYGGINTTTLKSSIISLLIIVIPTLSSFLAAVFTIQLFSQPKIEPYKKAFSVLIQILLTMFLVNVGLFVTIINSPQAAETCVTANDIKINNYCLLLLSKPGMGYRVLNPKGITNTINSPQNHKGRICQGLGPNPNSVILYDTTDDFFGATASTYQSIHNSVIDFATLISKNTSKIIFDADICATVTLTPGPNNLVTLTDTAVLPSPTLVPSNTPIPAISGDANNDHKVNGIDYAVWLANYGAINVTSGASKGDFNLDKSVNGPDYGVWLASYQP